MTSPKTVTPDQPQVVPDMVLVPREPTKAMMHAFLRAGPMPAVPFMACYAAMLAARPVLPVETPAEGLREALLVKGLRDAQAHINEAYDIAREAKDHGACHFHALASDAISDLLDDPSNSVAGFIIYDGGKQDEQPAAPAPAPLSGLRGALYELRQRAADEARDGLAGASANNIAETAYGWLGDSIEAFLADRETETPAPLSGRDGSLLEAIRFVEKLHGAYAREFGVYDPSTNATEFSGAAEDVDLTYAEILDGLRALAARPTQDGRDGG